MLGDWIPMAHSLVDDPQVLQIRAATGASLEVVVGRLYLFWRLMDRNTEDGFLSGATLLAVSVSCGGDVSFWQAVKAVGWIDDSPEGVRQPKFAVNNSRSARRRMLDAKRKKSGRHADTKRTGGGRRADIMRTQSGRGVDPESQSESESQSEPHAGGVPPTTPLPFVPALTSEAFQAAWESWLAYRKERRLKTTKATVTAQLKMLADLGEPAAIEAIQASIRNGWQGLFPPKESPNGRKPERIDYAARERYDNAGW